MPVEVLAPPLGTTADTVILASWYKREGEAVRQGEPLFAVETDKATLDVEAPASGILRQVSCLPGTEVKVLSKVAVIAGPDEAEASGEEKQRVLVSPRARRLAEEKGVGWESLTGSGPEGAIVERDVRAYLAAGNPPGRTVQPAGEPEVAESIPLAGTRAVIAERMAGSAAATARVTLTAEADATALVELRASLEADGIQVSVNDLFLYVLARALREHPRLNASLRDNVIQVWRRVDIGIAVDTERGLLVPVVRDVARKGLSEIARESADLIAAAQKGTSRPEDLRGGTFTLTNLGMYGIDAFTPIINLPECAILGVGRIIPRAVVVLDQVAVRQMVWLSLAFDHRLVDGGPAARFLQRVVQLISKPHLLLS